jgi:hypothetical protein
VVVAFIDQEQCSYTCMINIIKEGDEEKTMGYPGKEEGQIHLRSAVIGIGDADLRSAIEVEPPSCPRHAHAPRVRPPCTDVRFALVRSLRKLRLATVERRMTSRTTTRARARSARC